MTNMNTEKNDEIIPDASGIPIYCAFDKIVNLSELIKHPFNPNKHPPKQIELLAKLIANQGWRNPITVSKRSGFIVRGHGRYAAALLMQVDAAPIDFQDYESEEEELADMIADNRIQDLSSQDSALLADLLKELNTNEFDMDLTGFDEKALDSIFKIAESNVEMPKFDETSMNTDENGADEKIERCSQCGQTLPA